MGDLEDSFLKKNVPGRYTSWSEENDDERGADDNNLDIETGNDDSEDDEYYLEGLPPLPCKDCRIEPVTATTSNGLQKSTNTGVKGVLSDYHEAQRREKEEETRLKLQEEVVPRQSHDRHHHDIHRKFKMNINNNDDDGSSDEDQHEIVGENLKYWGYPPGTTMHPFRRNSHCPKVTADEYIQLLDEMENNVHKGVLYMVVHLYESSIPECRQLHSALEQMKSGSETGSSQFIEVDALEANPDMDTIILPAILIYDKRGELKHNLVRFTDDLPHGYTAWDLREYFDKLGIVV